MLQDFLELSRTAINCVSWTDLVAVNVQIAHIDLIDSLSINYKPKYVFQLFSVLVLIRLNWAILMGIIGGKRVKVATNRQVGSDVLNWQKSKMIVPHNCSTGSTPGRQVTMRNKPSFLLCR